MFKNSPLFNLPKSQSSSDKDSHDLSLIERNNALVKLKTPILSCINNLLIFLEFQIIKYLWCQSI